MKNFYQTVIITKYPKKTPVVIMAGGKGTRLMPYTSKCPKPMVKIKGKPMLEIILNVI